MVFVDLMEQYAPAAELNYIVSAIAQNGQLSMLHSVPIHVANKGTGAMGIRLPLLTHQLTFLAAKTTARIVHVVCTLDSVEECIVACQCTPMLLDGRVGLRVEAGRVVDERGVTARDEPLVLDVQRPLKEVITKTMPEKEEEAQESDEPKGEGTGHGEPKTTSQPDLDASAAVNTAIDMISMEDGVALDLEVIIHPVQVVAYQRVLSRPIRPSKGRSGVDGEGDAKPMALGSTAVVAAVKHVIDRDFVLIEPDCFFSFDFEDAVTAFRRTCGSVLGVAGVILPVLNAAKESGGRSDGTDPVDILGVYEEVDTGQAVAGNRAVGGQQMHEQQQHRLAGHETSIGATQEYSFHGHVDVVRAKAGEGREVAPPNSRVPLHRVVYYEPDVDSYYSRCDRNVQNVVMFRKPREESVLKRRPLREDILRKYPSIRFFHSVRFAGLFICRKWIVDLIGYEERTVKWASFGRDMMAYLSRKQFARDLRAMTQDEEEALIERGGITRPRDGVRPGAPLPVSAQLAMNDSALAAYVDAPISFFFSCFFDLLSLLSVMVV